MGWLVSRPGPPAAAMLRGAVAGGLPLVFATAVDCAVKALGDRDTWWAC